jgi:hypothetical protein
MLKTKRENASLLPKEQSEDTASSRNRLAGISWGRGIRLFKG